MIVFSFVTLLLAGCSLSFQENKDEMEVNNTTTVKKTVAITIEKTDKWSEQVFDLNGTEISISMPKFGKKTSIHLSKKFLDWQLKRSRYSLPGFFVEYSSDNQTILDSVAKAIASCIEGEYDVSTHARMIIDYVQNLEYVSDERFGRKDYTLFPVETMFYGSGDCEDKSILMHGLLKTIGAGSILIDLPGHVMVGVLCENCEGSYLDYDNGKYFFIETTDVWEIGHLADDLQEKKCTILD